MIRRVETLLDTIESDVLGFFKPEDTNLLIELMSCPHGVPVAPHHKHYVMSSTLAPDHIRWLQEELEEWAIVEHVPAEGFCFWFTNETDAVSFERSFN